MQNAHRWLIIGLAAALLAVGAVVVFAYPAHHDLAWLLYVAGELLDGASLYTGIVEVNPPLIIWLSVVAELLARVLGAWNLFVYRAIVLCTAVVSIMLCRRQLRRFGTTPDTVLVDLLTLLLCFLFVANVGFEFGQREHLAIVLVFPFLVLTARQIDGTADANAEDVVAGVMAGVGFAIKPHFVLAWLAVEVYTAVRRRRVIATLPHVAVAAVFALYAAAVLLFERDYFELARLGAGAYTRMSQAAPTDLLFRPPALLALAAGLLAWFAHPKSPFRELFRVGGVAAVGFLIGVLVQGKGWAYHWIPSITITAVVLPLVLWSWLSPMLSRQRFRSAGAVLAVAGTALLLGLAGRKFGDADRHWEGMQTRAYQLPPLIDVIERHAGTGPIAAFSTNMQVAFPLVNYTDVTWGLRFNCLWLLPGVYPDYELGTLVQYHPLDRLSEAESYLFHSVVEDLTRSRPTVLIVDRIPPGYILQGFDYLTYFGRDPRFADLMAEYREVAPVERYRIFVRN